jgi:hypothetical protein
MNHRGITLTLGAAAGGLLAAAFLPVAVAFADDFVFNPNSQPDVAGVTGYPPFDQDILAAQDFSVHDITTNMDVGTFAADTNALSTPFGFNNEEILVTGDQTGVDTPPTGSVFDTANFGNGFENIYADTLGTGMGGANTITDTFVTPFGDFNIPIDFDAAALGGFAIFP